MRINTFLILLCFSVTSTFAQSYKVKKGVLYKGKTAVANVEGKVNLTKVDMSVETLKGTPILEVKGHSFTRVQPDMEPLYWYTFSFPQFDQKFTIKQKANYINTKPFLKREFAGIGVHFYEDGFKQDELKAFEDYSTQLKADTMEILEKVNSYVSILTSGKIDRPLDKPVVFRNYESIKGLVITQGTRKNSKNEDVPIIIGRISYYKNEGQSISDPSRSHKATIYKKMPGKVNIDGRETDFVAAGYIDLLELIPQLYLYEENITLSNTEFRIDNKNIEDAKKAAKYMVKKGLL